MDVLGSEGGGVSRIRDTVGEQCFGISFWDFRNARWGTPSPGLAAFASSRTRLTAWLFHSRWSLFLHIRTGRMAATAAGAKVFLVWILHGD